jgi:hypothetical protein
MFGLFKSKDSPYVTEVKYFPPKLTPGKANFDEKDLEVEKLLHEIKDKLVGKKFMEEVKDERILLSINDIPDLKFTIYVNGSEIKIERQWNLDISSTVRLPLFIYNLQFLNQWLEKGYLDKEEMHRMVHTLAVPAVESFYHSEMVNKLSNPSILKLHKLIHLELKNPMNYEYEGIPLNGKVTVMNVMGQFIILPGHIGVAPLKYEVDVDEAIEYYTLLRYKLPLAKTLVEKKKLFDEYMDLRARTVKENPEYK